MTQAKFSAGLDYSRGANPYPLYPKPADCVSPDRPDNQDMGP